MKTFKQYAQNLAESDRDDLEMSLSSALHHHREAKKEKHGSKYFHAHKRDYHTDIANVLAEHGHKKAAIKHLDDAHLHHQAFEKAKD